MTGNNNRNECNNKIFKTIIKVVKFHIFDNKKCSVLFYSNKVGFFFLFFIFLLVFIFLKTSKLTDENSVHDQKKPLSLKRAISDALIGSQSDKVPSLIGVCVEVRISLWEGLN